MQSAQQDTSSLTQLAEHYDVDEGRLRHVLSLWEKHGLTPSFGLWFDKTATATAACAVTVELLDAGITWEQLKAACHYDGVTPPQARLARIRRFAAECLARTPDDIAQLIAGFDSFTLTAKARHASHEYRLGAALHAELVHRMENPDA